MADEKGASVDERAPTATYPTEYSDHSGEEPVALLPTGWRYKTFFGSKRRRGIWYASPEFQILLIAFVCFLCPGMFNAINGLGGAGIFNTKVADAANTAVYATFAFVGFTAGSIVNRLGVRLALCIGGIGYVVYVSSFLCYLYTQNFGYVVFAGFLLGCCAGILWSAQGVIMLSYPPEGKKGRYIAVFWVIFNLGGVIGSLIPLGQNIHSTQAGSVSVGTYVTFLVLTFCGSCLATSLARGDSVIRRDGSKVILQKNPTWWTEIRGLGETFKSDPYILLLFPMFFCSNWFYTYQFNDFNAAKFDVRTRSLNNVLYWTSQMIGAAIFGSLLDLTYFRRTTRARGAWAALFILTFAIWGGGYAWEKTYTRNDPGEIWDWNHKGYLGPLTLYMFYGGYDAAWQTCVYWFMGAMTNNGRKLANFAGFYKGIQSTGAAIIWAVDLDRASYASEFASSWALLAAGLLFALPVVLIKIKDTTPLEEDLKFSDETVEDVLGNQGHQKVEAAQ